MIIDNKAKIIKTPPYAEEYDYITNGIKFMMDEFADQSERLQKAIELPCVVGDSIYVIEQDENKKYEVIEYIITRVDIRINQDDAVVCFYVKEKDGQRLDYFHITELDINDVAFTTKGEAFDRLKELKQQRGEQQ